MHTLPSFLFPLCPKNHAPITEYPPGSPNQSFSIIAVGEEDLANLRNASAAESVFSKRSGEDPSLQDPFLWPRANAPTLVEAGNDFLHVSWSVPSSEDATVYTSQLQLIPPGEADWVTVMDRLMTWRFQVNDLLPGAC